MNDVEVERRARTREDSAFLLVQQQKISDGQSATTVVQPRPRTHHTNTPRSRRKVHAARLWARYSWFLAAGSSKTSEARVAVSCRCHHRLIVPNVDEVCIWIGQCCSALSSSRSNAFPMLWKLFSPLTRTFLWTRRSDGPMVAVSALLP